MRHTLAPPKILGPHPGATPGFVGPFRISSSFVGLVKFTFTVVSERIKRKIVEFIEHAVGVGSWHSL